MQRKVNVLRRNMPNSFHPNCNISIFINLGGIIFNLHLRVTLTVYSIPYNGFFFYVLWRKWRVDFYHFFFLSITVCVSANSLMHALFFFYWREVYHLKESVLALICFLDQDVKTFQDLGGKCEGWIPLNGKGVPSKLNREFSRDT